MGGVVGVWDGRGGGDGGVDGYCGWFMFFGTTRFGDQKMYDNWDNEHVYTTNKARFSNLLTKKRG
jgi:hypothetical protein